MTKFKHYIVTRVNLGLYRIAKCDPDEWFMKRWEIFKAVTMPSLLHQTCQEFAHVLLIDAETPKKHADMLWDSFTDSILFGYRGMIVPITLAADWKPKRYGERWSCAIDYSNLIETIRSESKYALQTRLDNDDALLPHAVAAIQDNVISSKGAYAIDFLRGFAVDSVNKKCYDAVHPAGTPFISLFQPTSRKMKSVYDMTHSKIPTVYPCITKKERLWIMNIHDHNISNRLFDCLIEKETTDDSFVSRCF